MGTRYFIHRGEPIGYQNKPRVFVELTEEEAMGLQLDTVTITVDVIDESTKAFKFDDSKTEAWVPKSLIMNGEGEPCDEFDFVPGDEAVEVELKTWIAEKIGFS